MTHSLPQAVTTEAHFENGYTRLEVHSPRHRLGDVDFNCEQIETLWREGSSKSTHILLFPELALTGYTLGDLFHHETLLKKSEQALIRLKKVSQSYSSLAVIGLPLVQQSRIYNCAAVVGHGRVYGIAVKSFLPNYREFYEQRWFFSSFDLISDSFELEGEKIPIGSDLLFSTRGGCRFGVEICEDLWTSTPPSDRLAREGADIILNLSASPELVGKKETRVNLARAQSTRLRCAYAYAGASISESTADLVFSGHSFIVEQGKLVAESRMFHSDSAQISWDIDHALIRNLRRIEQTHYPEERGCREISLPAAKALPQLNRYYETHPFVPKSDGDFADILTMQSAALGERMLRAQAKKLVLGLSGGMDSAHALVVCWSACKRLRLEPSESIHALLMPSLGSTAQTEDNAFQLCQNLGIHSVRIDLREATRLQLLSIGHDLESFDVTFENSQARLRTLTLMNYANMHQGIVVGTGNLSEIALGWSTYSGDHLSMYNVNAGIPKTLVSALLDWESVSVCPEIRETAKAILATPMSPELKPGILGEITQKTEDIIGPYSLHDFFLFHFLNSGFSKQKLIFIAQLAFAGQFNPEVIVKTCNLFFTRFRMSQFKRNAAPDGPKVLSVGLQSRSDWRMPSDLETDQIF